MRNGRVIFYSEVRRYGFLRDEQTQKEIFFHAKGVLTPPLKTGMPVTFCIGDYNGKSVAIEVCKSGD